jgi:NAD(P)-dependent dehydrogenase (short-subunit alcohol dehydrogenase family)
MGRLTGRVALVTGSGRGIGRAIALAYAREGARVGLTSRTTAQLEQVGAEILAAGGESFALASDLMDGAATQSMVSAMIGHFGQLDVLVNNGGGMMGGGAALHALTHDDELFEKNMRSWE